MDGTLESNEGVEMSEPWKCPYCGEEFYDKEAAFSHSRTEGINFVLAEGKKPRPNVPHYNTTKIQPIDIIEDWYPIWLEDTWYAGNAVKYLRRFRLKGTPLQDLRKARDYIDFLIEKYEDGRSCDDRWYLKNKTSYDLWLRGTCIKCGEECGSREALLTHRCKDANI